MSLKAKVHQANEPPRWSFFIVSAGLIVVVGTFITLAAFLPSTVGGATGARRTLADVGIPIGDIGGVILSVGIWLSAKDAIARIHLKNRLYDDLAAAMGYISLGLLFFLLCGLCLAILFLMGGFFGWEYTGDCI
jgi:hypothetical protein